MWMLAGLLVTATAGAQGIDEQLRQIERNNPEIQALRKSVEAEKLEVQTRNNLEDPSVEYSPFYTSGVSGMASSELVVTQGFDFPTLYAARNKAGKLQQEVLDRQSEARRQEILLAAKGLCLDLIRLNLQQDLLETRLRNAEQMLALFETRLAEGDANILDVNKIKMERMSVQTEVARNDAAFRTTLQQLVAMNGGKSLTFSDRIYPDAPSLPGYDALRDEVMTSDASVLAEDAAVRAAQGEVSVSKQNWLPKLEVGYRRNTDLGEKSNGFLVGGSLPLFSNRRRAKIVRAQAVSAQYRADDIRLKAEAALAGLYNEASRLRETMAVYDLPLMDNTLSALKDAVTEGRISVITYYTEAESVYRNMEAYRDVEHRFQEVMAEIYKYKL